jgi:DNA helicase HerA-like ATPase
MVLNILTQGRSYDIGMIFATQQFADLEKAKLSEEFMSNTPVKIVLEAELDNKSVSYIKDFLLLDDTAVKDLKLSQRGEGIIKIGDTHVPIAFIPSDEEMKIIKGFYTGNQPASETFNQQHRADCKI